MRRQLALDRGWLRTAATSDFIFDLTVFIETCILLARPSDRASCKVIDSKLAEIQRRCNEDEEYCTQRTIRDYSRSSTNSSEKVSILLSKEQLEQYAQDMNDPSLRPSRSIAPSVDETTRGDDRSHRTLRDDTDAISSTQAPPSTASVRRVSMAEESKQHVDKIGMDSKFPPLYPRPSGHRRAFSRIRQALISCFG